LTLDTQKLETQKPQKLVKNGEYFAYVAMVFLFMNMNGMTNKFRDFYLTSVLGLDPRSLSIIGVITTAVPIVLAFFFTMIVDRPPKPGKDKFRPIVLITAVPLAVTSILMFWVPQPLLGMTVMMMVVYQCLVHIIQRAAEFFAGTSRLMVMVMTPDMAEQRKIISVREIAGAIGNSGPFLVVFVMGLLIDGETRVFMWSTVLCAVAAALMFIIGSRVVKERVPYAPPTGKENPFIGFRDVVRNPSMRLMMYSEFLREFRGIASHMGPFMAELLLGSGTNFMIFGLPTGIGTLVGMLIVKQVMLKRFDARQTFLLNGGYSMVINALAFGAGVMAFRNEGVLVYQVIFVVFLFLIGLQYGATNILPSVFHADIVEDIEVSTGKRFEASVGYAMGLSNNISRTIRAGVAPIILMRFIGYVQPIDGVAQPQTPTTQLRMTGVFTLVQGLFILLGALPMLFYKLTGEHRVRIHEQAVALRAELEKAREELEESPVSEP